jgi:hypothetical protein
VGLSTAEPLADMGVRLVVGGSDDLPPPLTAPVGLAEAEEGGLGEGVRGGAGGEDRGDGGFGEEGMGQQKEEEEKEEEIPGEPRRWVWWRSMTAVWHILDKVMAGVTGRKRRQPMGTDHRRHVCRRVC